MSSTNPDVQAIDVQSFANNAEVSNASRNIHPETEIARLRNELARVRADLHDALSFARVAPWGVDLGSGRVLISDEGLERLGRGRDEVASTLDGIFSLFHPDDRTRAMSRLGELVSGVLSLDDTFRLLHRSGSIVHAWFRGNPVVDAAGRVAAIRGIWQDVTARVEIEESLRESEENHRNAVVLSAQVLWTAAPDGRILDVGPRWSQMTGLPVDDALGEGWAFVIHPEDLEAVIAARATSLTTGEPIDCDYRLRLADGSYRWMRARAAARRDASGGIVRWYGSLEDIHDRKVAERRLRSSEAFSRSVIESSGDSIMVLDHAGIVRFVNGRGAEAAGYDIGDLVGRDWLELSSDEFRTEAREALAGARIGEGRSFSASAPTTSGGTTWWDVALNPIRGETDDVRGVLVVSRDVTEKRAALIEADAAHDKLVDVLESTADAVLSIDRSWRVTYMNGMATDLLGHRLKVGCDMFETYPDYVGTEVHRAYLAAMSGTPSKLADLPLPNLGIHADLNLRPTKDGISVFLRDVSEAHEARRAIIRLAHHDPLTGLANRARYNAFLNEHCRSGTFGILLLDLDRFKEVNDTFGHSVGDALLAQAATRFATVVGDRGLLARLGGDEFAIVVPHAEPDACLAMADALVASLREPIYVERHILRIGLTVGISVEAAGSDTDAGFKRADLALYEAKADGGDRACLYDVELNRRVGDRLVLKHDLGLAIERNQLSVAYQPMLDLRDGRTCAREALLRWHHPVRGAVSPAEFIPLAEEAGLIVEIGDWVMRQACFEAAAMDDGAVISVNLSPIQFEGSGLELRVAGALAASGLPPSRLELEITESVLLKDSEENLRTLHGLKAMGVRIALDDFGTGFSSLSYLRNFRFDKIKIDRSFVADIGTGNHSEAIVAAVISLGRTLGMTITAEGVETECQLRWLDEHGCHQAQGYLIGRPGPIGR